MTRWTTLAAALLVACAGSHPSERPLVTDCAAALDAGQEGDPCAFSGECVRSMDGGSRREAAVCDEGWLLRARIDETREEGLGPCLGERLEEADADVSFEILGGGCVRVTFCNELLGGGASRRVATLCQIGASSAASSGSPAIDCAAAVGGGADGDPCAGDFACIADHDLGGGDVLPVVAYCDSGILRLSPSQALIHGVP